MKNIENVVQWADAKGLIKKENSFKQLAKTMEELGETASALLKDDNQKFWMALEIR